MRLIDERGLSREGWAGLGDITVSLRDRVFARPARASDAAELTSRNLTVAWIAAACDDRPRLAEAVCQGAAAAAAAVLRLTHRDGEVVMGIPGRHSHVLPPGPAHLFPSDWFHAVMMGLLARDMAAIDTLCGSGAVEAVVASSDPDRVGAEPYWTPWCYALASIVHGLAGIDGLLADAVRLMRAPRLGASDPASIDDVKQPICLLMNRLASGRTHYWSDDVSCAVARYAAHWSAPDRASLEPGFLALDVAGLCALAFDRGIAFVLDSPYVPGWLVRGEFERTPSSNTAPPTTLTPASAPPVLAHAPTNIPDSLPAAAVERAEFAVVLLTAGKQTLNVIKVVRDFRRLGLGIQEIKALLERAPCTLIDQITEAEAKRLHTMLREVGATAKVERSAPS